MKFCPLPAFVNKVLWEPSHTHFLQVPYGPCHIMAAELSPCNRHHKAHRAPNIYYLALYGRSLLAPGLAPGSVILDI